LGLYVNGLPLVVIELKDPANSAADLNVAIDQLETYAKIADRNVLITVMLLAAR
jgi:type I restriction enzyme R subunit